MMQLTQARFARENSQRGGIIFTLLFLLFLVALVSVLYIARHPLLRLAGSFWVVDEPAENSDVIVMLSDDNYNADRAARAAELFKSGLAPRVVAYGKHSWKHWEHPEFERPAYYWEWSAIHQVTCTAEDSYGDQYPVSQSVFAGFGLNNMSEVEDEALDRCYAETNGDQSCYLASCAHY